MVSVKHLTISLTLCCTSISFGQDMNYNQPWVALTPGERVLAFGIPQRSVFSYVEGTPYAYEEFQEGTVYGKKNETLNGRFRYNAFTQEIEKQTATDTISLLRREYLKTQIGADLYVIEAYLENGVLRKGYFIEKNNGRVRLLIKEDKELLPVRFPGSSYNQERSARFKGSIRYFLSIDNQPATEVRLRKRDIYRALPKHQKSIETYAKENGFKMSTTEEVLQVILYYNSL